MSELATKITLCIKTFERPQCLSRLLDSIEARYPCLPVVVADDSRQPFYGQKNRRVAFVPLPYDTGLSAGRNAMLERVETPLFVMMDDDFELVAATCFERWMPWLEADVFDLVGGALEVDGQVTHYEGYMRQDGDILKCGHRRQARAPLPCDIVLNFFAARTDAIRPIGWDPDLKMGEHQDFYLRLQEAGVRVGYLPTVVARHHPERGGAYSGPRHAKAGKYRALFRKKRGIAAIEGSLSLPAR